MHLAPGAKEAVCWLLGARSVGSPVGRADEARICVCDKASLVVQPNRVVFGAARGALQCHSVAPSRLRSAAGERPKGQGTRARRRPQLCLRPRRWRRLLLRQSPHWSQARRSPQARRLQLQVQSGGWQTGGGEHSSGSRRSGPSARARRRRPQRLRPRWRRPLVLGAQQAAVAQLSVAASAAQRAQAAAQVAAQLAAQQQAAMAWLP